MSFDQKPTYELIGIAKAGLGFTMSVLNKPVDDLIQIAAAAQHHGAKITFTEIADLSEAEIQRIKLAGKDNIVLIQ